MPADAGRQPATQADAGRQPATQADAGRQPERPTDGNPPIRARRTVCGSLAHADPAAELPAVAVALDATFVAARTSGRRTIAATDFDILEPADDLHATAGYRRHVAGVLLRRAVARAYGNATGAPVSWP